MARHQSVIAKQKFMGEVPFSGDQQQRNTIRRNDNVDGS